MNGTSVFQAIIWDYYQANGRHDLPWRQAGPSAVLDSYHIVVSEMMLQQTQVSRVIPKYLEFLELFPTVQALSSAELSSVLRAWSGLGYNRRAKFLWQAAGEVVGHHDGTFPSTERELVALPGIGKNTAGAVLAYAYNQPAVYVETNIRTVFLHHFFDGQNAVSDAAILSKVAETLDLDTPREWYWALMDYGSYLKKSEATSTARSASYVRQSTFQGSRRQIRGQVIRHLTLVGTASYGALLLAINNDRLGSVLADLVAEGMIHKSDDVYRL